MRRKLTIWLLIFLLSASAFSQTGIDKNKFVGKTFWTKFVLATLSDCKIEITPDDLSPSENFCHFYEHLEPNTAIKLKALTDEKDWARLTFEVKGDEFEVFIKNDTKRNFRKSFALAFSKQKLSGEKIYGECISGKRDAKTPRDVIRKMGFPSKIGRDEVDELWTFTPRIQGDCGGDITYVRIKNGQVTQVYIEI